jgi:flavin-dependent dehydrogenase
VEVDVAIIGAGPAGATLAALLAMRGISAAVIDRDTFPRDKLCGEFLSYDALPIADALGVTSAIDAAGAPRIERCRIVGSRRAYEFAFPHAARGVSRMLFDDLLLRAAVARGAEALDGWTATSLDAAATITIARGGETRTIAPRVIVGAWGRWGRFDQQLGRAFVRDRAHRSFGFKRHYRGDAPRDTIELYSFRGGYLGVNAIESRRTNICGLAAASRLSGHKGRWDAFVDTIRDEEPVLDAMYARYEPAQESFLSSEPVIFRARSAVERGVFMIGDASGIVDPLTGNGMAMALQSALLAAPHIAAVLGGAERTRIEDDYRRAHHAFFAPRIAWSRRAARLLSRPRLIDAALATRVAAGPLLLRRTRADRDAVARMADRWFSIQ